MPTPHTRRSVPRILLTESERSLGRTLCSALEGQGYSVLAFRSSDAALYAFNTEAVVNLVVTERAPVGLPGLALVAALRERGFAGPAILLVDAITPAESADAERLGVVRLLHKPFGADSFVATVREVFLESENPNQKPK